MRNFLLAFIIFLGWSIVGIWYYNCITKNLCVEQASTNKEIVKALPEEDKSGLYVASGSGSTIFEFNDQLEINDKNATVYVPEALLCYRDSIFNYLNTNQDEELLIQGYYKSKEIDSLGSFGIQRAGNIKDMLVNHGVNAARISIEAIQETYDYNEKGVYEGGIKMSVNQMSKDQVAKIDNSITTKTLYASFGSKDFKPDSTLKAYTIELIGYLERNPHKNVTIIGHTDDVGSAKANLLFGNLRALNVKNYLVSQGIDSRKIKSSSKGETDPIASNANETGRAKNRRIEIHVN